MRRAQNDAEPTQLAEGAVDPAEIAEGVMKILSETDWEIELVDGKVEESANELSVAVPVETGTDGQVLRLS